MKHSTSSKTPTLLAIAGLLMTLGTGCAARTVDFAVTRPAILNLQPMGNTVGVGTIQPNGKPEAAAQVAADLRERVAHSLNPSVRLLPDGAAVVIDGAIVGDSYEQHTETVSQTCSKTVDDGVDANGTSQSHTESYDCSYNQEVGTGVSNIRFRILEGGGDHRVLLDHVYVRSAGVTDPSKEDIARLMHEVRAWSVEQFAKVILPWQDKVSERFKDCDGDYRCKQGLERVKNGDLAGADALFTQVIGGFGAGTVVPAAETKRIGEAFYDRGVTRAHQRRYDEAVADMEMALQLQPKRAKWPSELASVKQMARDTQALQAQGATP